jgi:hypothetical protein
MSRRPFLLSALVSLFALSAHAGTLTNATWFQGMQGIPLTRSFFELGAAGSSTATSIAVSLSYPPFATTHFVPKTLNGVIDLVVQVSQGGPQAITATANAAAGIPGIPGTVVVMTALHGFMGVNQSVFMIGTNTIVEVPLSVGKAAQHTGTFVVLGHAHAITVDFLAWTPGTVRFTGLISMFMALPNVTAAGSFNLSANGGGTVSLVAPSKVSIDGQFGPIRTASFTKLVMRFAPEPGALLLLGAGAVALGVAARLRPQAGTRRAARIPKHLARLNRK